VEFLEAALAPNARAWTYLAPFIDVICCRHRLKEQVGDIPEQIRIPSDHVQETVKKSGLSQALAKRSPIRKDSGDARVTVQHFFTASRWRWTASRTRFFEVFL
jgi:hypothetical protein